MRFVTHEMTGADGMVRGMFAARSLSGPPAAHAIFPGVRAVAILPKRFDSADAAKTWLEQTAERGGNAVAVQIAATRWLIGAWVADVPA
ncbi:MAG TPA: hypothetical protein VMJ74_01050 [Pseudomonadales bacterium]|nr:hypothetical protein [Pseudomonadales bacterium]